MSAALSDAMTEPVGDEEVRGLRPRLSFEPEPEPELVVEPSRSAEVEAETDR